MPDALRRLLQPLNLAGVFTIASVGLSLQWMEPADAPAAWALLGAFAVAFLLRDAVEARQPRAAHALLVLQPLLALAMIALSPRIGTAQILLVVWTVVAVMAWPGRLALASVVLVDVAAWAVLHARGHGDALTVTLLYAGFQAFAALCAHYARSAEQARDRLARVNADLLATRALLADATRDAERLRMARELHDVAGHTLTALTLNLRALAADPALATRPELEVSQRLAAELMADIRGVVQALRDARGLDLATALHALAAPLPRPRLHLAMAADVRVDDPAVAETVLRLVQEALTNSARHAGATRLDVALARDGARLTLRIEDDGRVRGTPREGNGLSGMRERVAALGGRLAFAPSAQGAMRIDAELPA